LLEVQAFDRGKVALTDVDLRLSVEEVNIDTVARSLAISGRIENVTNDHSRWEGRVCNLSLLGGARVGQGNEELTTGEGIEAGISVSLNEVLVPDLGLLSLGIDLGENLVEIRAGVHVLPERLSVSGVVAAVVVLLSSVIGEGDTSGGECEYAGSLKLGCLAWMVVEEASVVVIIDEETESINVSEVLLL